LADPAGQLVPARRGSFSPLRGRDRFRPGFLGETTCPVPYPNAEDSLTTKAPRAPSKFLLSGFAFLGVLGALVVIIRSRPLGERVRTAPRPPRLSSSDLGPWTLDLGLAGRCPVSLGNDCPRLRRAPRTTPPQAGFSQPTAPSGGQRIPSFYASGNNSEIFLDSKACDRGGSAGWTGGRRMREQTLSHPVGAQEGPISSAPRSQAGVALRPGL
jgi:hypothetical protein